MAATTNLMTPKIIFHSYHFPIVRNSWFQDVVTPTICKGSDHDLNIQEKPNQ